ncbi:MAG TPA: hypothetical protein VKF32_02435 [Thermoanaerobaculia bacterium]|nr:hypothetical protein [Thermoanaerobaculia bacterium]
MDIPAKVYVTCPISEMKQVPATLIAVSPHGYYELHVVFGANTHAVLLPVNGTALTTMEPMLAASPGFDVER